MKHLVIFTKTKVSMGSQDWRTQFTWVSETGAKGFVGLRPGCVYIIDWGAIKGAAPIWGGTCRKTKARQNQYIKFKLILDYHFFAF